MRNTCDCEQDGFCTRYNRDMYGRMRELCRGINVDMGTAAAFREAWRQEALPQVPVSYNPRRLLLKTDQAPGDAVAMTAAVYSLHRAHPGQFLTAVETPYTEVFAYNPDVVEADSTFEPLEMHYPAIHTCNQRGIHFMQGWCEFLSSVLEVPIPLLTNRPHLYFAPGPTVQVRPYWLVCSGVKSDFTTKRWGGYQWVVDALPGIEWVQVGTVGDHVPLRGAVNVLGRTSLRQLFELVRGCEGVLCGVSLLMHVAAALEKPAVVIAGGREPVQWNAYPKQHYLHTIGALDCCESGGCWKSRVVPLGDNTTLDASLCLHPVVNDRVPLCMEQITIEAVRAAVEMGTRQSTGTCSQPRCATAASSK